MKDSVMELVKQRPGAEVIQAANLTKAVKIEDFIYMSSGTSNAYMVVTEQGRVIINTGMGFESLTHKKLFDEICAGPTPYILLTQGHVDHVGGVKQFREKNTKLIAQENLANCQQDDERIAERRQSQSYIWFSGVIDEALKRIDENPDSFAQDIPVADITFQDQYAFQLGGVSFEIYATPGGETIDACVVWLPQYQILFSGNVFGPLFPHFPNFNTIRGDKYRDVERYLESLKKIKELHPKILITGHGDPIHGKELIQQCLERMQKAVVYVHQKTLKGIEDGKDIFSLMKEIQLPPELEIGEGYGRVAWAVRTIWESYIGWFKLQQTSELYPTQPPEVYTEFVELAGISAVIQKGRTLLQGGETEKALLLAEAALKAKPNHQEALKLSLEVHQKLLGNPKDANNFWLGGWVRHQIKTLEEQLQELQIPSASLDLSSFSVKGIFEMLPSLFIPEEAKGVDVTFQYCIPGASGGNWFTVIRNQTLRVEEGIAENPTCTITIEDENFIALNLGKLNPLKAVVTGKLKVEGDKIQARLLDKCFKKITLPKKALAGNDIRFTDIAKPQLSYQQKAALLFGKTQRVQFTQSAVLKKAKQRTGLSDFGAEDFKDRLQILLNEYRRDNGLTDLNRYLLFNNLVRYASNRLLIENTLKKHPEIQEIEIEKPIIVVGLPRSGTTHLLNLLAADKRFRSLPLWESYEPIAVPGKEALHPLQVRLDQLKKFLPPQFQNSTQSPLASDPRYRRCDFEWKMMQIMAPHIAAMHPMNPDHIHEELEFMGADFASYVFEWTSMVPKYRDHYYQTDQTPHYEYMKKVLKIAQWQRGPNRWVLKCPQHLEQLPVLLKTFPDATFVVTHRDPVSVIQSAATMLAYAQRMGRKKVETQKLIEYWTDRVEHLLQACVRDYQLLPKDRRINVLFHEFMADDVGTIEKIYQIAGIERNEICRQQQQSFIENHPRGKNGRVIYDLKGNFGVDPESLRKRFQFYYEQFPVQIEKY